MSFDCWLVELIKLPCTLRLFLVFKPMAELPVHIILLTRSQQRTEHVHNVLLGQLKGAQVTVHDAVDAKTADLGAVCDKYGIVVTEPKLRRGQVACALSHYRVWVEMAQTNVPYAVVLEDDAYINDGAHFTNNMREILSELPPEWEIVFLYVTPRFRKPFEEVQLEEKRFITKPYFTWGTVGYLVSQRGVAKLIDEHKTMSATVDDHIQYMDRTHFYMTKVQVVSSVGAGGDVSVGGRLLCSTVFSTDGLKKFM